MLYISYPFTEMSVQVAFINTRPSEQSMRMTKPKIVEEEDGSATILYVVQDNEIERYKRRTFFTSIKFPRGLIKKLEEKNF